MSDLRDKLQSHLAGERPSDPADWPGLIDAATGEILQEPNPAARPEDSGMRVTMSKLGLSPQYLAGLISQLQPPHDRIEVCLIYGRMEGLRPVKDIDGKVWKALAGDFEALNLISQQHIAGSTCFLPGDYHKDAVKVATAEAMFLLGKNIENDEFDPASFPELEAALEQANKERTRWEPKGIEFKAVFSIVKNTSARAPLGYSWLARWLDNIRKADPLRALRSEALSYRPSSKSMPISRPVPVIEHQPGEKK